MWKWILGLLALAGAVFGAYVGWRRLVNTNKVLKAISNLRGARIKSLEQQLAVRHAEEKARDEAEGNAARGSAADAARFLSGKGSAGRDAGGPVRDPDPTP